MTRTSFARSLLPLALAVLVLGPSDLPADPASDSPQYEITDLGSLDTGSNGTTPAALNSSGDVVGVSSVSVPPFIESRAFLYTAEEGMQAIVPLSFRNFAFGINSHGDVVGSRSPETSTWPQQAFLYTRSEGVVRPLEGVPGSSAALSINDANQVVGYIGSHLYWDAKAFLWSDAGFVDLHAGLAGASQSAATGINAGGVVVGWSWRYPGGKKAFRRSAGGVLEELNAGGWETEAAAVNASGQVVGTKVGPEATDYGLDRAVLWDADGTVRDLGVIPGGWSSSARALNTAGVVVGQGTTGEFDCPEDPGSTVPCTAQVHAFIHRGTQMEDLNDLILSGYELVDAAGINDEGQIVATGRGPDGGQRAFLLTPSFSPVKAIGQIIVTVQGFGLPDGIETSFTKKLEHALAALEAGDTATACGDLQDFINHASAQSGKKLTVEQAGRIIAEAEAVRAALGCS